MLTFGLGDDPPPPDRRALLAEFVHAWRHRDPRPGREARRHARRLERVARRVARAEEALLRFERVRRRRDAQLGGRR